jgi:hypothetical protein
MSKRTWLEAEEVERILCEVRTISFIHKIWFNCGPKQLNFYNSSDRESMRGMIYL